MYHRVVPRKYLDKIYSLNGMVVFEDIFDKQIQYLSQHFNVISLDEYLKNIQDLKKLPPKSIVVTFDDGWKDNAQYAYPILKKYNCPFTLFITTNYISSDKLFWQEKIKYLYSKIFEDKEKWAQLLKNPQNKSDVATLIKSMKNQSFDEISKMVDYLEKLACCSTYPLTHNAMLTWDEIASFDQSLASFGAHGCNHAILTICNKKVLEKEICESKNILEHILQKPIIDFAYPNGNYNREVIDKVKECGYRCALATEHGLNKNKQKSYQLKRINIGLERARNAKGNFSPILFKAFLTGVL